MSSREFELGDSNAPINFKLQHLPAPRNLSFSRLVIVQIPAPLAKIVFKCPTLVQICLSNAPRKEQIFLVGCRAVIAGPNRLQASVYDATTYVTMKRVKLLTSKATLE